VEVALSKNISFLKGQCNMFFKISTSQKMTHSFRKKNKGPVHGNGNQFFRQGQEHGRKEFYLGWTAQKIKGGGW
jgi:hypothetical protein